MDWLKIGQSVSGAFKLDLTDVKKVGVHALVVGAGAAVSVLIDSLAGINIGPYTVLIMPIVTSGLEALRRYIKSNEIKKDE